MIRVYPSSKVKHAPMWRELQNTVPHVFFNARWPYLAKYENDIDHDGFRDLWIECKQDVMSADAVLLYVEEDEILKGALVEVGIALANNIPIIFVAEEKNRLAYGTWVYVDGVEWVNTLAEAFDLLYKMDKKWQREERARVYASSVEMSKKRG